MSVYNWHTRAECPECKATYHAPFGNSFHIHFAVCPDCGAPKRGWAIKTMRWANPDWHLLKPWTWGLGRWEVRGGPA